MPYGQPFVQFAQLSIPPKLMHNRRHAEAGAAYSLLKQKDRLAAVSPDIRFYQAHGSILPEQYKGRTTRSHLVLSGSRVCGICSCGIFCPAPLNYLSVLELEAMHHIIDRQLLVVALECRV